MLDTHHHLFKRYMRDFPGQQWLRLCLPMQGVWVRSLVGELGSHMPQGQKATTQNRSNIVTNSINTLKLVHIKKKSLKNKRYMNIL